MPVIYSPESAGPAAGQVDTAAELIAELTARRLTIAVAESLTGGLLVAELVRIPGASAVLRGGLVAYDTALKRSLLHVDSSVLNVHGPVHADVAKQMAGGVRTLLAVDDVRADVGVSTTGVAGPGQDGGHPAGTVFIGLSKGTGSWAVPLQLHGDRTEIRAETVRQAIDAVRALIAQGDPE
ncbi:nicotinamide-nucleotide amidohydrolase family protein [Cryobacterium ruanii]|uniref:Nicotinamide-nucleotide amidohydrolase family protein n=2 Tax=Cryobacterium ruanii TaxID=1259197 RepID=A0A4R9AJY6_9MICO|nr:nicotinamide-nucleotide amidohydrolase family protein [Cryobacterium ruanii]